MMKYGFEREYFLLNKDGQPQLVPDGLPKDECGYLVEARGEAHGDPMKAAFLLLAVEHELVEKVTALGLELGVVDTLVLSKEFARKALRLHGKPSYPMGRGNLYGLDYKASDTLARAGLHVHFSSTIEHQDKDCVCRTEFLPVDMPRMIRGLDTRFKAEIKAAKRIPGCYEMKAHGFEARSLPATLDVVTVAKALKEIG